MRELLSYKQVKWCSTYWELHNWRIRLFLPLTLFPPVTLTLTLIPCICLFQCLPNYLILLSSNWETFYLHIYLCLCPFLCSSFSSLLPECLSIFIYIYVSVPFFVPHSPLFFLSVFLSSYIFMFLSLSLFAFLLLHLLFHYISYKLFYISSLSCFLPPPHPYSCPY